MDDDTADMLTAMIVVDADHALPSRDTREDWRGFVRALTGATMASHLADVPALECRLREAATLAASGDIRRIDRMVWDRRLPVSDAWAPLRVDPVDRDRWAGPAVGFVRGVLTHLHLRTEDEAGDMALPMWSWVVRGASLGFARMGDMATAEALAYVHATLAESPAAFATVRAAAAAMVSDG